MIKYNNFIINIGKGIMGIFLISIVIIPSIFIINWFSKHPDITFGIIVMIGIGLVLYLLCGLCWMIGDIFLSWIEEKISNLKSWFYWIKQEWNQKIQNKWEK